MLSAGTFAGTKSAYRVVKFIVNVRLVEKRANSTVGKVIVVKVMIHISIPGITLTIASIACPNKLSHDVGEAATSCGTASPVAEA